MIAPQSTCKSIKHQVSILPHWFIPSLLPLHLVGTSNSDTNSLMASELLLCLAPRSQKIVWPKVCLYHHSSTWSCQVILIDRLHAHTSWNWSKNLLPSCKRLPVHNYHWYLALGDTGDMEWHLVMGSPLGTAGHDPQIPTWSIVSISLQQAYSRSIGDLLAVARNQVAHWSVCTMPPSKHY